MQSRLGCLATALALAFSLPGLARAQRVAIADVVVSPTDAQARVGRTMQFFAAAFDRGNNVLSSVTSFTWRSSNPRVATIDANGVATGLSPGITLITARIGSGRSARTSQPATLQVSGSAARAVGPGCAALVNESPGSGTAVGLVVSPLRVMLVRGEPKQLEFYAVRGDGANAAPVCVAFSIEEGGERIVEVDPTGMVWAGQDTGTAVVRAVSPEHPRWQPKEIVVDVRADSVRFNVRDVTMAPGTTDTLALIVPAQSNRRIESEMFQFSSSDSTKVRVLPLAAIVTAVAPGSARITATNSRYPDLTVTVVVRR